MPDSDEVIYEGALDLVADGWQGSAPYGVRDGDLTGSATGPVAMARLRNAVTHPRRRHGGLSYAHDVWLASWQLSVHHLELLIPRKLGYVGEYMDWFRAVWHGDVQQVSVGHGLYKWSAKEGR